MQNTYSVGMRDTYERFCDDLIRLILTSTRKTVSKMNNGRSPIIILPLPFFVIPYIPLTQSHFKTLFLYLVCSDNRQKCVQAACITLTHTYEL